MLVIALPHQNQRTSLHLFGTSRRVILAPRTLLWPWIHSKQLLWTRNPSNHPLPLSADEFKTFYTRFEMSPATDTVSSDSPQNGRVTLHTAIIKHAQGWMFFHRLLCKLKISSSFFQSFTEPLLGVSSHHPSLFGSQHLCQRQNKVSNWWYIWPGGSHARSKCLQVFFRTKVLKKLASRIVADSPIHPGHFLFSRLPCTTYIVQKYTVYTSPHTWTYDAVSYMSCTSFIK